MRVHSVKANNHKRAFEVRAWRGPFDFPYSKADPVPTPADPLTEVFVDEELAGEGFSYLLASGREGSVLIDQVLEYNRDPGYMRDHLLYDLTLAAQQCLEESPLSKREVIRRLGTSPAQFYRLLDQTNYRKSVDKLLSLLQVLDCDVELVVHRKAGHGGQADKGTSPSD